ncbi:MAG: hypothetical protein P4N59_11495 [Negativicutes bacterium]|nr:hypothetical protein [Negativicutes bacterium]
MSGSLANIFQTLPVPSFSQIGQGISDIGGAVSDLFQSQAYGDSVQGYEASANQAFLNAKVAQSSANVNNAIELRTVTQGVGTTAADLAGAGFADSGTGLALVQSSAEQGAQGEAVTALNGQNQVNNYNAQGQAYLAEAAAAKAAQSGSIFGGIFSAISAVASFL